MGFQNVSCFIVEQESSLINFYYFRGTSLNYPGAAHPKQINSYGHF